mmetsp:Transcript_11687/g.49191  ORF Transcript_11687/g.49191 Transcript_11687/m.49191 type:complete len:330 (+) Transcript_11687:71-1060(+)
MSSSSSSSSSRNSLSPLSSSVPSSISSPSSPSSETSSSSPSPSSSSASSSASPSSPSSAAAIPSERALAAAAATPWSLIRADVRTSSAGSAVPPSLYTMTPFRATLFRAQRPSRGSCPTAATSVRPLTLSASPLTKPGASSDPSCVSAVWPVPGFPTCHSRTRPSPAPLAARSLPIEHATAPTHSWHSRAEPRSCRCSLAPSWSCSSLLASSPPASRALAPASACLANPVGFFRCSDHAATQPSCPPVTHSSALSAATQSMAELWPRKMSCVSSCIFHARHVRSELQVTGRSRRAQATALTSVWCPKSVSRYAISSSDQILTLRSSLAV